MTSLASAAVMKAANRPVSAMSKSEIVRSWRGGRGDNELGSTSTLPLVKSSEDSPFLLMEAINAVSMIPLLTTLAARSFLSRRFSPFGSQFRPSLNRAFRPRRRLTLQPKAPIQLPSGRGTMIG
jgi:hypothetical protein